jgi:phosphohistidine phosphatase
MRIVYLLRHAQAESAGFSGADKQRPLSQHGILEAKAIAQWLCEQEDAPTRILASSAKRAWHTTQLVNEALGLPLDHVTWEASIYDASAGHLLELLRQQQHNEPLLLVGHNPGLEMLLRSLTQAPDQPFHLFLGMGTANLAKIVWPNAENALQVIGHLAEHIQPSSLLTS